MTDTNIPVTVADSENIESPQLTPQPGKPFKGVLANVPVSG